MSRIRREQAFANNISFSDIACGPWDLINTVERVWHVGEYSALFHRLVTFLDLVLTTEKIAFDVRVNAGQKVGKVRCRALADCFPMLRFLPDICFSGYACSPDIQLFQDCYALHREIASCSFVKPDWHVVDGLIEAEIFNDFVATMREQAKRRNLKKVMHNWMYGLTKRQQIEIRRYLRTMPNKTTKLLAVRCDGFYLKQAISDDHVLTRSSIAGVSGPFADSRDDGTSPETAARIDAAHAMEHRREFLENQLGKDWELFEHLIGYVWKIEQSKDGVIHHHILFIFDGQQVKDEFVVLDRISERWRVITNGAGFVNSSHFEKREFREGGKWRYGMIESQEALDAMIEDAATYFTKVEQPLRFKPTPHARTLAKGRPWSKREGGPGRPRKSFI
ncbi:inovirus-type Gp2 protein [Paraburkholderia bryophila]|uniref:YagK/YfjJ domain-containing protein n=1 Tax=Paraburkholderia bryophila TaxID=420952 RepID=UPI00234AE3A0|nr:inovirus-type Gp2 protein [Paraburkholderia bryophila]WCM18359.1 inovirus-type Gp2 protein [Paraburkholderia bryophila]